ncbi:glycine--tRNA ligase [Candidatus Bathyarchaeota archaeon]|nr:glycine--tRNA ligase [Candidatus Bathyarchaeota archaeon]
MSRSDKYDRVMELARRRGFFWPSYEIYGGVGGFIDYGPAGLALKRKIEDKWRDFFLRRHGFLEIETPIITPQRVFEASGHIESFKDPVTECIVCRRKYRPDHLLSDLGVQNAESMGLTELDDEVRKRDVRCPECGGDLSPTTYTQTMFKTTIGPYADSIGYGRPEAAQGIFVNFRRLHEVSRERFPIGIGQIGHALRNEISPRQGPLRLREFTIMEFEFFFDPEEPKCPYIPEVESMEITILPLRSDTERYAEPARTTIRASIEGRLILMEWMAYFMALSQQFLGELGIPPEKQRFSEKLPAERAHYSAQTFDQEILLDRWGWTEVAGHAYRTSYDLSRHIEYSGVDMRVFRPLEKPVEVEEKRLVPILSSIRREFGEGSSKVLELLNVADPEASERQLLETGSLRLGEFTLNQSHVRIHSTRRRKTGKRLIPHVVEPSFGADRLAYAVMEYAYTIKKDRVILSLPASLTPYRAVILPLVERDTLVEEANRIFRHLVECKLEVYYDAAGSIGRRYARADEIGVPLAVTIDYETLNDGTVTVRERDSWKQLRVHNSRLPKYLQDWPHGDT